MDYEKLYKEALKKAKKELSTCGSENCDAARQIFRLFPELKESWDERIRNELLDYLKCFIPHHDIDLVKKSKEWIDWIEKQGKQESFDYENINIKQKNFASKVESKFKVGDCVASNICNSSDLLYIIDIYGKEYKVETPQRNTRVISIAYVDSNYHLWTIKDSKNGDVLATENFIFIFKNIDNGNGVHYYCHYEISKHEDDNRFDIALPQSLMGIADDSISHYSPATEEQRDLMFSKMKEAGYEWDAEKKELRIVD